VGSRITVPGYLDKVGRGGELRTVAEDFARVSIMGLVL